MYLYMYIILNQEVRSKIKGAIFLGYRNPHSETLIPAGLPRL